MLSPTSRYASALSALLLASCTVGPDYQPPALKLPDSWLSATAPAATPDDAQLALQQAWWKQFNDPMLNQLIEKATAGNFDLKIAEARIAEARATRSSARADLLPVVNTTGSAIREGNRLAFGGNIPFDLAKPFNNFQAGFDASWELDVFGRKRREIEADTALLQGEEANLANARVSLLAEVARSYVDIRAGQRQLTLAQDTADAYQHTGGIVRELYETGNSPKFDLTRAQALLEQAQAQIPFYQNQLAQAEFGMDVLLGEQPGATAALVTTPQPIPTVAAQPVLAAPASIIANRPDLKLAERQLAAATAQQGVATAQFFPDISLSGFFGLLSADNTTFLEGRSRSWEVAGNVAWPILNYAKLKANLNAADARQQEALFNYEKAVNGALSDVEQALTAYYKESEHRAALEKTTADDAHAADIAAQRYKEGLSNYLDVLDAQRTLYAAQSQLAQAQAQEMENLVAVYKSVGGGWKE